MEINTETLLNIQEAAASAINEVLAENGITLSPNDLYKFYYPISEEIQSCGIEIVDK